MSTEIVYKEHDNTIDLVLKSDGAAQDLSGVTKITASFGNTLVSSTDKSAGLVTWDQAGYDTGEIRIAIGNETIVAGEYNVPIIIYDSTNTDGIVWGYVYIRVIAEVEAS